MPFRVRPAAREDAIAIHALLEKAMPQGEPRAWPNWVARWEWSRLTSPWRREDVPVGLVAESESGGPLQGYLGLVPIPLRLDGETIVTQASETFAVDDSVRGRGLGRRIAAEAWDAVAVPQPVSFSANATSSHLFAKFGGVAMPPSVNRTFLGVLDASGLVRRLRAGGGRASRALSQPGVAMLARALAGLWIRGRRLLAPSSAGFAVEAADSRVRDLDSLVRSSGRAGVLTPAYDAAYFAWRYESAPRADADRYRLLAVREPGGALAAFACVEELEHPQWGGQFAQLMDLLSHSEIPSGRLLASLLEYGRSRRWVALRVPSLSPDLDRAVRRAGFVPERLPSVSSVLKPVGKLRAFQHSLADASCLSLGLGCRF